jgi:hypothetical protein
VKKPSGGKPGMVIYVQYQTVVIAPREPVVIAPREPAGNAQTLR